MGLFMAGKANCVLYNLFWMTRELITVFKRLFYLVWSGCVCWAIVCWRTGKHALFFIKGLLYRNMFHSVQKSNRTDNGESFCLMFSVSPDTVLHYSKLDIRWKVHLTPCRAKKSWTTIPCVWLAAVPVSALGGSGGLLSWDEVDVVTCVTSGGQISLITKDVGLSLLSWASLGAWDAERGWKEMSSAEISQRNVGGWNRRSCWHHYH